jgi:hypothetical protein
MSITSKRGRDEKEKTEKPEPIWPGFFEDEPLAEDLPNPTRPWLPDEPREK